MPPDTVTVDLGEMKYVGNNVSSIIIEDKHLLILVVDLHEETGLSNSGKMMGVANTGGFTKVPGTDLRINMYVGRKMAPGE